MNKRIVLMPLALIIAAVFAFGGGGAARAEMKVAVPQIKLPEDELPHDVPVEWWYISGHLTDAQGRRYGVMASFFTSKLGNFPRSHFMIYQLVEKDAKKFYSGSLIEKSMVNLMRQAMAGMPEVMKKQIPPEMTDETQIAKYHRYMKEKPLVKKDSLGIKYDDEIFARTAGEGREWKTYEYKTRLTDAAFTLDLKMSAERGPMFVGGTGNVGSEPGVDMFYYSFTRLGASGVLRIGGEDRAVTGTMWYDHQFGAYGSGYKPVGWDWFCVQLEDGTDLNLSALRRLDTGERFNRLGTVQWADGRMAVVNDLVIEPLGSWKGAETGITYPSGWLLAIPSLGMSIRVAPEFPEQEMHTFGPMRSIWEGACKVETEVRGKPLKGDGYTELVGYGYTKP